MPETVETGSTAQSLKQKRKEVFLRVKGPLKSYEPTSQETTTTTQTITTESLPHRHTREESKTKHIPIKLCILQPQIMNANAHYQTCNRRKLGAKNFF